MSRGKSIAMNREYFEQAYEAWKKDPNSIPADLARFFEGFEFAHEVAATKASPSKSLQSAVDSLVYHYRDIGHRIAQINPLGGNRESDPELELAAYGLSEEHLDYVFDTNHIVGLGPTTLREIIAHLRETYCGPIGVEYMHIQETVERRWLQQRMESGRNRPQFPREVQLRALWKLKKAEMFEHYLHTNFRGQKRFSLEGGETLIAAMDYLVEKAAAIGIRDIIIGMAHRGRLNVLANIVRKGFDDIFSEFEDNYILDSAHGDGDVKYHKGFANDIATSCGQTIRVTLCDNPSHLEMVGPVVQGLARAEQAEHGDTERKTVLPFVVHGDAAFAGQGIVAETFNMSQLKGYRTGGTIHFVINNQVGFTTVPQDYLSGMYCTDMAKIVSVPIFHVNGDCPEHVMHVMDIALDYRQKFGKDVVIDMWCYRRHGHNEGDEPGFTLPLLYSKIARHPSVVKIYADELARRGEPSEEETRQVAARFEQRLAAAREQIRAGRHELDHHEVDPRWAKLEREYSHEPVETGVDAATLRRIGEALTRIPEGVTVHRKIKKLLDDFAAAVRGDGPLQWADAERLAFGSLLIEGTGVRLSGEDSRRGTFSQRHAVIYDQVTGEPYIPLCNLAPNQGQFCVYDSALAEASVLAFDYGYSLGDPDRLILWEAQFGDFANGAQVIFDQFIASGMSKWGRMSGLVMLLPHGYEGQGPEHSNGWLRRHLTMCAEDNIQVVNCTTPAQYFHLLRRQVRRRFRRPLIVLTPKSLLRHPRCVSTLSDLTRGHFHELLDDPVPPENPRRVLFCSGKVYYDLIAKREEMGAYDVAIVRVEQLYPIHEQLWDEIGGRYAGAAEWAWVSEEPSNYGAYGFAVSQMATLHDGPIWYVGRARAASPATGSPSLHKRQQERILYWALQPGRLEPDIAEGVAVYTRGNDLWHLKSKSPHLASPSPNAP
ncbi:MAG: 2-oxoglutarate dehydrogenase E1 component [Candidatus Sumerlaeaceae bacterium]|nr:2-oxoglutarate dehydrogenase E1 component [Candidatus Sumerlaeaceae bacterium]